MHEQVSYLQTSQPNSLADYGQSLAQLGRSPAPPTVYAAHETALATYNAAQKQHAASVEKLALAAKALAETTCNLRTHIDQNDPMADRTKQTVSGAGPRAY